MSATAYCLKEMGHLPWLIAEDEVPYFGRWVLGIEWHALVRSLDVRCCNRRRPVRMVALVVIEVTAPESNTDASW